MPVFRDLTGQKFGRLTVLRRAPNKGHQTAWDVRCDCGEERVVRASYLTEGRIRSCGCARTPDLSGQRYGRLTVRGKVKNDVPGRTRWLCVCDCGNTTMVIGKHLANGNTKSCGCLKLAGNNITHQHTRGGKHSPEYRAWGNMLSRCRPLPIYKNHGARGITVCDRWRFGEGGKSGFECFYEDMGPKPSPDHQIERRDNDGPYCPENCYWATRQQQQNNKRTNVFVEVDGRVQTKTQWRREIGWRRTKFNSRIRSITRLLSRSASAVSPPPFPTDSRCETPWFLTWRSFRNAGSLLAADTTKLETRLTREERRELFKAVWVARDAATAEMSNADTAASARR
jgi:hypothetical protein